MFSSLHLNMRYGIGSGYNRTSGIVGSMFESILHDNVDSLSGDFERQCNDLKLLRDWEITKEVYQERNKGAVIPEREELDELIQWFENVATTWKDISNAL